MASASAPNIQIDESLVQAAIQDVVTQIRAFRNRSHEDGEQITMQSNFNELLEKIHDILTKLDQLSSKIQDFSKSTIFHSTLRNYLSSDHPNPTEILNEIERYKTSLEVFLNNLSSIHNSSNNIFITLVQMAIEGLEIPTIEEFSLPKVSLPTLFLRSAIDATQSTPQDNNTCKIVKCLIHSLGENLAWVNQFEQPLNFLCEVARKISISFFKESMKLSKKEEDACGKIANMKREMDKLGIKERIERLDLYMSSAIRDNPSINVQLSLKIWTSFLLVNESVNSCKAQHPDANDIDIVNELIQNPQCAGLVQPIVSLLGCSLEEGWKIILEIFSQLQRNSS
ncbi:hypothetical protein LOD99_7728 [Oopsacas minuta]|uniref:Uncharacterized protein n=1 Tax=Oopsacas minuta TaxID=111878 RepID=A0AAV7JPC7_9METZ|nr:hypothetical protein LOD99_7728 [Oopsacas minuta]